mgnify:CR=1 FL=1
MRYPITPVPKPRMTQRDKWSKRTCVVRYWDFKDEVRRLGVELPKYGAWVTFYLPMPKSWSSKKKSLMNLKSHTQKPDLDNLIKGLGDAVYDDDSGIWDIRASKWWAYSGAITIDEMETEN